MNNSLLVIDSSGRTNRSLTRRLSRQFVDLWSAERPGGTIVYRDLTIAPPKTINEDWIAAAFADPSERTAGMNDALALSDLLLDEIISAEAIVIGAPVYNFGMPAVLKAYCDQIVRVGRSFGFNPGAAEPYTPLLAAKPVIVITAAGDGSIFPGGGHAHLNFLEPSLKTIFSFIGLEELTFVRVGYEEYQDARFTNSLEAAQEQVRRLASARLADVAS